MKKLIDIDDVLVVLGVGLVSWGIWMIYRPAALIAVGLMCLSLGLLGSRLRRRRGKDS